jgi:hypothetical protein
MTTRWHYLPREAWNGVRARQVIAPHGRPPLVSVPLVWFSTATEWEPIAGYYRYERHDRFTVKLKWESRDQTARDGQGLVRIGVRADACPNSWPDLLAFIADEREKYIATLCGEIATKQLDPKADAAFWWASYDPVPASQWIAVEQWTRRAGWGPVPEEWRTVLPPRTSSVLVGTDGGPLEV